MTAIASKLVKRVHTRRVRARTHHAPESCCVERNQPIFLCASLAVYGARAQIALSGGKLYDECCAPSHIELASNHDGSIYGRPTGHPGVTMCGNRCIRSLTHIACLLSLDHRDLNH
jgi:hypothetical protein